MSLLPTQGADLFSLLKVDHLLMMTHLMYFVKLMLINQVDLVVDWAIEVFFSLLLIKVEVEFRILVVCFLLMKVEFRIFLLKFFFRKHKSCRERMHDDLVLVGLCLKY